GPGRGERLRGLERGRGGRSAGVDHGEDRVALPPVDEIRGQRESGLRAGLGDRLVTDPLHRDLLDVRSRRYVLLEIQCERLVCTIGRLEDDSQHRDHVRGRVCRGRLLLQDRERSVVSVEARVRGLKAVADELALLVAVLDDQVDRLVPGRVGEERQPLRRVGFSRKDARQISGGEGPRSAAPGQYDEDDDGNNDASYIHPSVSSPSARNSGKPKVHVVSCTRSMIRQPTGVRSHWSSYAPPTNITSPSRATNGLKNSA